jgi:hypothetical protein
MFFSCDCADLEILFGLFARLRAFLHASELVPPVSLKSAGPLVERPDRIGVGAVKHLAAVATNVNQANFEKHSEVLRDRRLREIESGDDVVDGALLRYKEAENVAATGFGHGVKGVGGGGGARHEWIIFPYRNMSRDIFSAQGETAGLKPGTYMRHKCAGAVKIDGYVEPDCWI